MIEVFQRNERERERARAGEVSAALHERQRERAGGVSDAVQLERGRRQLFQPTLNQPQGVRLVYCTRGLDI